MIYYNKTSCGLKAIGYLLVQVILATLATKISLDEIKISSYWIPDVILS
jgi:hypothetical protein